MGSTFARLADLSPYVIWDGAVARAVHGERLTVGVIDLDPDLVVAEHEHENEQLGFVLKGEVTMIIGDESRLLRVGDTYSIPSHVRHSARTSSLGATVVDVFAPVRADWETKERSAPSPGRWP